MTHPIEDGLELGLTPPPEGDQRQWSEMVEELRYLEEEEAQMAQDYRQAQALVREVLQDYAGKLTIEQAAAVAFLCGMPLRGPVVL